MLNNKYFRYSILIIAGAISVFAYAPYNFPVAIILSLLIFLSYINLLSNTLPKVNCCIYGYIYASAFFAPQIYWIFYSINYVIKAGTLLAVIALIACTIFLATYIVVMLITYLRIKTRFIMFNVLFLFPSVWVFFEWLRGWLLLDGYPWSDIGYTQVNSYIFLGYFRIFGIYGVSWLCVGMIGALWLILYELAVVTTKKVVYRFWHNIAVAILYIAIIFIIGLFISPIKYTTPTTSSSVALIQGNILALDKWGQEDSLRKYESAIINTKADIVILPETAISQFEHDLPSNYINRITHEAKSNGANLVLGMPVVIDNFGHYVNAAVVVTNPAHPYYAKYHLVPYGEYMPFKFLNILYNYLSVPMVGFSAGNKFQPALTVAKQKIAFNICYENGFANELIKAAASSSLMVNLSDMAWFGNTIAMNQHLQLSQARAIENERYFIQVTNTSITAIINPNGKIQSQLHVFKQSVLKGVVWGMVGVTPFEIIGNWLIISLCAIIIFCTFVWQRLNPQTH